MKTRMAVVEVAVELNVELDEMPDLENGLAGELVKVKSGSFHRQHR